MVVVILVVLVIGVGSIVWTHLWGAPWVPSSMSTVHGMMELAEVRPGDVVYDLGSGDGRVIITAARRYGAEAVGIEVDPLRYLWCQMLITVFGMRDRVRVVHGDFFRQDLSDADVVTCYLLQDTNERLAKKLYEELRPGARLVSNSFTFAGMQPVREQGHATLYVMSGDDPR